MRRQTFVYIACSPHRHVGTTTTARLLADYFAYNNRPFQAFDTDPHESPFAACFPREAKVADVTAIQGQITMFDQLLVHDEVAKIVDVWNHSYRQFFAIIREIGFFEEARRLSVEPILLFMADRQTSSIEAAQMLRRQWPDLAMVIVDNEGAAPLGADIYDHLARYPSERTFQIPALDPAFRATIEDPSFSLSRFLIAPPTNMSIVLRSGLRSWLARIFAQFQSFELRMAMQDSEYLR
jgi:hypothetical protein